MTLREEFENEIKNNNDWTKICSETDLPQKSCHCLVINKFNGLELYYWKQHDPMINSERRNRRWLSTITHWKELEIGFPKM